MAFCDGKPRQADAFKHGLPTRGFRQSFRSGGQINDEPDHSARLIRKPQDAETAHLDQARKRLSRSHQQTGTGGLQVHAIIADESREQTEAAVRRLDEFKGQP